MARMIPPVPYSDTNSQGELSVFKRLRDEPGTDDWIVLHSVNLARHQRSISGEADFVVIVPRHGVLVLEVKGCSSLRLDGGMWHYGKDPVPDHRGPFRQASQAMWSLRDYIVKTRSDLANILFTSACVFPFCEFPVRSPEWHDWQVIDRGIYGTQPLGQQLLSMLARARSLAAEKGLSWASTGAGQPTTAQSAAIASLLRPRYEFFESAAVAERRFETELRTFTRQQARILDALGGNQRVLVEGPAGSGKTVLALETVRRLVNETDAPPRKIVVVCFNSLLAAWLRAGVQAIGSQVTVETIHGLMLRCAGIRPPPDAPASFWNDELPRKALAALRAAPESELFDVAIIDEAQDCAEPAYLDFLDACLRGGLESGTWHAFGDFEKQALFEHRDGSVDLGLALLRSLSVSVRLRSNCRNTPRIASLVRVLAGLDPDYDEILRPDDGREAQWLFYGSYDEGRAHLVQVLEQLIREGVRQRDVVVLSARRDDEALARDVVVGGRKLVPLRSGQTDGIRYGTIHSFKGLEARAVVLTDISSVLGASSQDLFYVGVTRAQSTLVVLADGAVRGDLVKVLSSGFRGGSK